MKKELIPFFSKIKSTYEHMAVTEVVFLLWNCLAIFKMAPNLLLGSQEFNSLRQQWIPMVSLGEQSSYSVFYLFSPNYKYVIPWEPHAHVFHSEKCFLPID
jgi:hypothetical protein